MTNPSVFLLRVLQGSFYGFPSSISWHISVDARTRDGNGNPKEHGKEPCPATAEKFRGNLLRQERPGPCCMFPAPSSRLKSAASHGIAMISICWGVSSLGCTQRRTVYISTGAPHLTLLGSFQLGSSRVNPQALSASVLGSQTYLSNPPSYPHRRLSDRSSCPSCPSSSQPPC